MTNLECETEEKCRCVDAIPANCNQKITKKTNPGIRKDESQVKLDWSVDHEKKETEGARDGRLSTTDRDQQLLMDWSRELRKHGGRTEVWSVSEDDRNGTEEEEALAGPTLQFSSPHLPTDTTTCCSSL